MIGKFCKWSVIIKGLVQIWFDQKPGKSFNNKLFNKINSIVLFIQVILLSLRLIKKILLNNFRKLGLSQSIIEALDQLGFINPTPIQAKAITMLLSKDPTEFIRLAQTGTGETAAFGLPLIDLVDVGIKDTQALIMAPTRELGQQTAQQLINFSQNNKQLNIEVVYGGTAITNQIKALKRPTQIVVATPGRLLDLIKRMAVSLSSVR